jgi:hypothetical protein
LIQLKVLHKRALWVYSWVLQSTTPNSGSWQSLIWICLCTIDTTHCHHRTHNLPLPAHEIVNWPFWDKTKQKKRWIACAVCALTLGVGRALGFQMELSCHTSSISSSSSYIHLQRRMVGLQVNKLELIRKEAVVAWLRLLSNTGLVNDDTLVK